MKFPEKPTDIRDSMETHDKPDAALERSLRERARPPISSALRKGVLAAAAERLEQRAACEVAPVPASPRRHGAWHSAAVAAAAILMFGLSALVQNTARPPAPGPTPDAAARQMLTAIDDWPAQNDPLELNLERARARAGQLLPTVAGPTPDPLRVRLDRMNRVTERIEARMREFSLPAENDPELKSKLHNTIEREVG